MNIHQRRIYDHVVGMISGGGLKAGDKLPTEMELGSLFKTGRLNAHYAVKSLEDAGLVSRNRRGGTIVSSKPGKFLLGQLKSATANRVCVLNQYPQNLSGIHWNDRLRAPFENALRERGLELAYRNIHDLKDPGDYKALLSEMVSNGCKALVLIADGSGEGVAFDRPELLSEFHDKVFIFDPGQSVWQDLPCNTVSINLFGQGVMAAERLIAHHGLSRIAVFKMGGPRRRWFDQRFRGVNCAIKRLLGEARSAELLETDTPDSEMIKSLAQIPGLGVIAANDMMAARLCDAAREGSVKLGDGGLKLVSFDDDSLYLEYGLTTVAPSLEAIGRRLASMILSDIDGQEELACVRVNSKLIIRQTA